MINCPKCDYSPPEDMVPLQRIHKLVLHLDAHGIKNSYSVVKYGAYPWYSKGKKVNERLEVI